MSGTFRFTLVSLVGLLAALTPGYAAGDIEQPEYEVTKRADGIELRAYAPYIVAEVTVNAGSMREASRKGFMPLAGYIFGDNRSSDEIAMTAPVTTQAESNGTKITMTAPVTTMQGREGTFTVRFSMPSKWTMDTLPKPNNKQVRLVPVEAEKRVAYRFVGDRSPARIDEAAAKIGEFAAAEGLKVASPIIFAGYDAPSVPAEKRRWEVMQMVE